MKKHYLLASVCMLLLAGCGGMTMEQMKMMEDMKTHMNEMQFQVNKAETDAARAKEMAHEAMMKSKKRKRMRGMMK